MNKILVIIISILSVLGLNSCQEDSVHVNLKGKKVLIAYMSWSGNTETAAERISEVTGGDMFKIEREEPYPEDLERCLIVSKPESQNNERPAIKGEVANFEHYDVVFIGTPVWWSTCPMPVFTFLENYNFASKTVIPFSTSSSGKSRSHSDIERQTRNATHLDGLDLITDSTQGEDIVTQYEKINEWLRGFGY